MRKRKIFMVSVTSGILTYLVSSFITSAVLSQDHPLETLNFNTTGTIDETTFPVKSPNKGPAPGNTGNFTMYDPHGNPIITNATYDSMPFVTPLDPAGPQETMTRWVDGWGYSPGHAEDGTVYVLGHAWATAPLVFNPLSEVVTKHALNEPSESVETLLYPVSRKSTNTLNGSRVVMSDAHGNARVWVIDNAWMVDKNEAIDDKDLMDDTQRGRLVLIACSVSGDADLGYNVVVTGRLEHDSDFAPNSLSLRDGPE